MPYGFWVTLAAEQPGRRAAPQLPRASGQCPAPPSTDPPPKAEDRRLTPPLLRTGQFAPLTRRTYHYLDFAITIAGI